MGSQAPPQPKSTTVNYTLGSQANPKPKTVDISPHFVGSWTKHITLSVAKGMNNILPHTTLPSLGSLAKGSKYGRLGPRGKGGLTLTGEEGFEIAWLPSESRSMILGTDGPQMINLPSDAVVYTHEQSKDILRKKQTIDAGSHAGRHISGSSGGSGGGSSNRTRSSSSSSQKVEKAAKTVEKAATDSAKAVKKVSVWWENIALRTEESQRKQEKNQKAFEKYLKQVGANIKNVGKSALSGGGGLEDYMNSLGETMGYWQAQYNKASQELVNFTTRKGTLSQNQMKSKYGVDGYENIAQISYKSGKDTKEEFVDLAKYARIINGKFLYDQAALDREPKERAKAIYDAMVKAGSDIVSKKNKAEDEIEKTQEALDKIGEQLYETFLKWEVELTKIWQIAKKIEQVEESINRIKNYESLLNLRVETGLEKVVDGIGGNVKDISDDMFGLFISGIKELENGINLEEQNIEEQKTKLQELINFDDMRENLTFMQDALKYTTKNGYKEENATKSTSLINDLVSSLEKATPKQLTASEYEEYKAGAKALEDEMYIRSKAWEFMSASRNADGTMNISFDEKAFETQKYREGMSGEDAEKIQAYVKEVIQTSEDLAAGYSSLISKATDMHEELKTLQDQWVGYAEELWKISEAEQQQEIDNLKKLSDSLSNTLKNLLDEVKRKLDQRRKEEDNTKTEQDISRKQQRLSALRADTSSGNQVEIARLQQEIADAQQNYQRSLEDQLLESLQQQGDMAAQQREQQIALQEATISAVNNAALVNQWMNDPLKYREELFEAYKTANDFDQKPKALQEDLIREFNTMFNGLTSNQAKQETVQTGLANIETTLTNLKDVMEKTFIKPEPSKTVTSKNANTNIKGQTQEIIDKAKPKESKPATKPAPKPAAKPKGPSKPQVSKISRDLREGMRGDDVKTLQTALKQLGMTGIGWKPLVIDGYFGPNTASAVREFQRKYKNKASKTLAADGVVGRYSKEAFRALGYKTGGLADYTGPAWLDGTPSKPELVLNATDTKNFLALRDVLSSAMKSTSTVSNSYGGDIMYEINVNVDHLNNDYDVDKVVEKVKKEITKGAGYRNVTQVRNFR